VRSLVLLLVAGCGGGDAPDSGPPPICRDGTAWDGSSDVFRDKTKAWGLDDMGITGIRFNAVDVDGDGWVDLTVRTGDAADDFDAEVRNAWLLRNTGDGGFEDVTESSGIRQSRAGDENRGRPGAVWVWADVDNDGDLDVYTGLPIADEETSEVLINQGDWTFELGPKGSPVRDPMAVYGASFTDVDRDGQIDLWLANFAEQSELLLGKGDGGFTRKTEAKGLETEPWIDTDVIDAGLAHSLAWSSAACDLNDDGWPELLASSYGRAPNHLWQGNSEGFVNRSVDSGYAYDDRVDWTDNESARCHCQLHPTDEDCEGVPPPEVIPCNSDEDVFRWDHDEDRKLYRLGGNSGQAVCGDLDNDGALDLVTTEIVHWDVGSSADPSEILHNTGEDDVVFERPGNDVTGLVREHVDPVFWDDGDITAEVFDIDNDGWSDVYIGSTDYPGTRGLLYRQDEPLRFTAVPENHGIDQLRSHGSVAADFDRDGDLDLIVGQSPARCDAECYDPQHPKFFENVSDAGNFLQLELVGGSGTNRAAIGARITIEAGGITQTREVAGGDGQYGDQTDLVQHVGLGEACEADVTIRWPDAALTTETFTVGGGYRWRIEQGDTPEVVAAD